MESADNKNSTAVTKLSNKQKKKLNRLNIGKFLFLCLFIYFKIEMIYLFTISN